MAKIPMSAQDALWLTMDRPNNLMVVDSAVVLAGTPTLEAVTNVIQAAVGRFPVLVARHCAVVPRGPGPTTRSSTSPSTSPR